MALTGTKVILQPTSYPAPPVTIDAPTIPPPLNIRLLNTAPPIEIFGAEV
jgi:hypothetical protein